jgi:para-nitrobenzyl esterase
MLRLSVSPNLSHNPNLFFMKFNCRILLGLCLAAPVLVMAQGNTATAVNFKSDKPGIVASKDVAVVQTSFGKLRGYMHNSIFTYKGIPYARAERFMPPTKPAEWTNVRTAFSYGPVCPTDITTQVNDEIEFPFNHNWGYSNENCQVLNVWSGGINDGKKRPVMVWLHGGGFTAGSSIELPSYDGEALAKKGDVVVVSINHRLNILGHLDLSAFGDKYKASANVGMLDALAALHWVKDNIAQFGGDPNNVTIFGQSGGGGKVTTLMSAPAAKGYFHKAIVQSGSYLMNGIPTKEMTQKVGAALLEELGLQPSQVDSLKNVSYEKLLAAGKKAQQKVNAALRAEGRTANVGWGPVQDGDFLPYQPSSAEAMQLSADVPMLVGTTKNEFTAFAPGGTDLTMDSLKAALQRRYGARTDAYMAAVKKAYPNTSQPFQYNDIDFAFRPGAVKHGNSKAALGKAPVFMYLFNWQSPVNDGRYKAMHCMELPFVFNNVQRCEEMTGGGKEAYTLADQMSGAWINFARTGDPNYKGLPKWPSYTEAGGATMLFDVKNEVRSHPDKELLDIVTAKPM